MESRIKSQCVMAKLMGLDKEPSQHPFREKQRVLSEEYLQKVASIGFRRKRLPHQHNFLRMNGDENEECGEALRAFKTIKRDETHKLSTENRNLKQGRTSEKGNMQTLQEIHSDQQRGVSGETRLYEMLRFSRSQLQSKCGTFPSRIIVLKPNDGKGESSLKCFSLPFGNYPLVNGMLKDFSSHESSRSFSEIKNKKSETCCRSSEILKPVGYDHPSTETKDACLNSSLQETKKQQTNVKSCSTHSNHRSYPEKSKSLLSCKLNSNFKEESYVRLHKLKEKFFGDSLSEQKPKLPELSASQACLINDEVKDSRLEQNKISKQNIASHESSIYGQVAEEKNDAVERPFGNPKIQLSATTTCFLLKNSDSSSHSSYGSIQQEESEFQVDDSVYSVRSEAKTDSSGSFEQAYETSPISVLEGPFGADVSFRSDCTKFAGDDLYDSSEMDNEGPDFNVSSDEGCEDGSVGDLEEKQDFVGFFRAEESREFSYLIEVLTEAALSNIDLYTDFCTWHTPQCPISPSVFENLEIKFGKQQFWKRSDRMLLFDRINLALMEILQPCMCIPAWEKPVSRRLNAEPSHDTIEEQLWELLVAQEKEAKKESEDKILVEGNTSIGLRHDIEDIVREIVEFFVEELEDEIISL